jgi:hypothetical protein
VIDALRKGDMSVLSLLGAQYIDLAGIVKQSQEFGNDQLKISYLKAVAGKILIIQAMQEKDPELAKNYAVGKFRIGNACNEDVLGRALLAARFAMSPGQASIDRESSGRIPAPENLYTFVVKASDEIDAINSGSIKPGSGTVTRVIDLLFDDLLSDYNMRKLLKVKYGALNERSVSMIFKAA